MRKRIATLAALAVGFGLFSATPASAVDAYNVFKIGTTFTKVVATRSASVADLENTFTVSALKTTGIGLDNTAAVGTLKLTGPSTGDWARSTDFQFQGSGDNGYGALADGTGVFHETYLGGGVYNLDLLGGTSVGSNVYQSTIRVRLKSNAPAGVYTAEVAFGSVSAKVSYELVANVGTGSSYLAIKGDSVPVSGPGAYTGVEVKAAGFSGYPSMVRVSGAGASFSNECGSSLQASAPFTEMVTDGTCDDSDFVIYTPYKGDVKLSWFGPDDNGTGFDLSAAYMTMTFTVGGTVVQPADPTAGTASNLAKAQADLAAVTATVTALQTAVASLIASTAATLTTLTAQINKIMRKLGIK